MRYVAARMGRTTQIVLRDVKTRFIGDVAVVTGINDLAGRGVRGADDRSGLSLRFTQVWVLQQGAWLREAFQATLIDQDSAPFA